VIEIDGISKRFGAVRALEAVSFEAAFTAAAREPVLLTFGIPS
jgi:hypothetical protein